MTTENKNIKKLDWIDAVKAFALLGILLNHIVESKGIYPWFTNPASNWPDLTTRLHTIFPQGKFFLERLIYFLGWLGDNCVGVFIVISGLTLTVSALRKPSFSLKNFYERRLLRIFPLYITIHLLVIFISLFIPGQVLDIGSPKMLMSLLGLRFIGPLFYYVNPSWWFIGLILQLYIIFPLLYRALQKTNIICFLSGAIIFTILSRAVGIVGFHPMNSLYSWMSGAFFGTRLAEFALGMVLGKLLTNGIHIPKNSRILFISVTLYVSGFAASLFWIGTTIHNLLISAGLTGIFYLLYQQLFKKHKLLNHSILWIGVYSFSIYLIHQMGIVWTKDINNESFRFILQLLLIILLSYVGTRIEKRSDLLKLPHIRIHNRISGIMFAGLFFMVLFLLAFIQPRMHTVVETAAFNMVLFLIMLVFAGSFLNADTPSIPRIVAGTTSVALLLSIFLLAEDLGKLVVLFILITTIFAFLLNRFKVSAKNSALYSTILWLIIIGTTEIWSAYAYPIEAKHWGEYPALEPHSTRVYGLIPNKTTHLRYNNYDYTVKTNSLGLACPEKQIHPNDSAIKILFTGDAFTMPEGMEWEDSYTGLLQKQLDSIGENVTIINAGVTGYGPNEELPQLEELIPLLKPDKVLLQFFANEFIEINTTREERLCDIGFIKDQYNSNIKPVHLWQLKKLQRRLISALKGRVSEQQKPKWYYDKCFMPLYEKQNNYSYYADTTLHKLEVALVKMDSICKSNGASFTILYTPAQIEVSAPQNISYYPFKQSDSATLQCFNFDKPYQHLQTICNKHNISLVNLKPELKNHPRQPVYFPDSWHWNKEGHKVVENKVYKYFIYAQ